MRRPLAILAVLAAFSATAALAESASLSPVIGVSPSSLDFGCVSVSACSDLTVQLSNAVSDPGSLLNVTGISVSGTGFSLASGPSLPVTIPGNGTTIPLLIRFCPQVAGSASGTLTVTASNAINSPRTVPLTGTTCTGGALSGEFIVRFSPGAITPPANPEGPLALFRFNVPGLRAALEAAGVEHLRKLLPWFTAESVHTTNALGEEVLLSDLSTLYVASVRSSMNALDAVYKHPACGTGPLARKAGPLQIPSTTTRRRHRGPTSSIFQAPRSPWTRSCSRYGRSAVISWDGFQPPRPMPASRLRQ